MLSRRNAMTPAAAGYLTSYGGGGRGFGINRNTWRAGQTVGRALKRWWSKTDDTRAAGKAKARKKQKTRHDPAPRMEFGEQIPEGHGHSLSKVFLGKSSVPKSLRGTLKSIASNRYVNTPAGVQVIANLGYQTAYAPTGAAQYTDLLAMETATSLWVNNANATMNSLAAKWFLESYTGTFQCTNSSAAAATMTIYDCVARRDAVYGNAATPVLAWANGLADETTVGTTADNQIGSLPFESDLFTQFWKVVKKTNIILSSGETHKHIFNMDPNQLLHTEYVKAYAASSYGIYKDLTYFPLIVVSGMPVHDATTTTIISTGKITLDTIFEVSYAFKYLQNNVINWYRTNSLANTLSGGQQEFNEAVGQAQDSSGLHAGYQ